MVLMPSVVMFDIAVLRLGSHAKRHRPKTVTGPRSQSLYPCIELALLVFDKLISSFHVLACLPWSCAHRYFLLSQHSAAPLLKQASPLWAWYEHLLPPTHTFSHDMHDLPETAGQLLSDMGYDPASYWAAHGKLAAFAPNKTAPAAYLQQRAKQVEAAAAAKHASSEGKKLDGGESDAPLLEDEWRLGYLRSDNGDGDGWVQGRRKGGARAVEEGVSVGHSQDQGQVTSGEVIQEEEAPATLSKAAAHEAHAHTGNHVTVKGKASGHGTLHPSTAANKAGGLKGRTSSTRQQGTQHHPTATSASAPGHASASASEHRRTPLSYTLRGSRTSLVEDGEGEGVVAGAAAGREGHAHAATSTGGSAVQQTTVAKEATAESGSQPHPSQSHTAGHTQSQHRRKGDIDTRAGGHVAAVTSRRLLMADEDQMGTDQAGDAQLDNNAGTAADEAAAALNEDMQVEGAAGQSRGASKQDAAAAVGRRAVQNEAADDSARYAAGASQTLSDYGAVEGKENSGAEDLALGARASAAAATAAATATATGKEGAAATDAAAVGDARSAVADGAVGDPAAPTARAAGTADGEQGTEVDAGEQNTQQEVNAAGAGAARAHRGVHSSAGRLHAGKGQHTKTISAGPRHAATTHAKAATAHNKQQQQDVPTSDGGPSELYVEGKSEDVSAHNNDLAVAAGDMSAWITSSKAGSSPEAAHMRNLNNAAAVLLNRCVLLPVSACLKSLCAPCLMHW